MTPWQRSTVLTFLLAGTLAGCVGFGPPPTTAVRAASIEDQKKDIAILRNQGRIGYAEAARRQYAIERSSYRLSPDEERFWQISMAEAARVDARQITPDEYQRRVQVAYARYVRPRG
ncbi:hypothetical protein [Chthonobacter albigriseus]|uniref:hypothetical protein n=1 Tax=Chthonobacter albigriseus TaxID=1683161 RepID=UPI0015EF511E|nr:hypothetical protein [Chthonobacter albigriseus]